MAIDIAAKLASGETLTEFEVKYARDRGIALPEEYGVPAGEIKAESGDFGRPPRPTISVDQYPRPSEAQPGVTLDEDTLNAMTKAQIADLGAAMGVELSGTKAEMIAQLMESGG
jgi:hypothetical protein